MLESLRTEEVQDRDMVYCTKTHYAFR